MRITEFTHIYGRSACYLSHVFNDITMHLATHFRELLEWRPILDNYYKLKRYARAIERLGGGYGIWGFIDGTFQAFCRPRKLQRKYYSGHTCDFGLKYQAIVTPDGIVSSLFGPYPGPWNDWSMLQDSKIQQRIRDVMGGHRRLYLYGDSAYSFSYGIWAPFQHPAGRRYLNPQHKRFNKRLASVRIAVEQAFGLTQNLWTRGAFPEGLQSGSSPVAAYFITAILLTNCYTWMRGSQNSRRFQCTPPTVEQYLRHRR
jgi:hypothetical protein